MENGEGLNFIKRILEGLNLVKKNFKMTKFDEKEFWKD